MGIFESYTYNKVYFVDLFLTSSFIASVELSKSGHCPGHNGVGVAHVACRAWEV